MPLADELKTEVEKIFSTRWTTRDGTAVPEPKDVGLGNDAVKFEAATVLYADLSDSTGMVSSQRDHFAAEVYKSFLYSAARVIRSRGRRNHRIRRRPNHGHVSWWIKKHQRHPISSED